jgi:hypothetical protein
VSIDSDAAFGVSSSLIIEAKPDPASPFPEMEAIHYDFGLARAAAGEARVGADPSKPVKAPLSKMQQVAGYQRRRQGHFRERALSYQFLCVSEAGSGAELLSSNLSFDGQGNGPRLLSDFIKRTIFVSCQARRHINASRNLEVHSESGSCA